MTDALLARQRGERTLGASSQLQGVEAPQLQPDAAGTEARQVEDVADEPLHALGVALDGLEQECCCCSSVGSLSGSSSRPTLVRTAVSGVRSSWAMVESRSVRRLSSSASWSALPVDAATPVAPAGQAR